jgi:hypothetical protein
LSKPLTNMVKLSITRLAVAMTIFGVFVLPPTVSFAAPNWLEKLPQRLERLFSPPQPKPAKRRKPRPAAKVTTPHTAPIPAAKPEDETPVDQQRLQQPFDGVTAPDGQTQAGTPVTEPSGPLQGPPMPQPKPEVPAEDVRDQADATQPGNPGAVPIPEPSPRATPEDGQPSPKPAGPVQGPPIPPAAEASPQEGTPPETVPIPEPNPRATEHPEETAPTEAPQEPPPPPDPRSAQRPDPSGHLPAEEIACRQRLTELGVKFDNRPAESDPSGCSMPYPITVKSLGKDVGLQPDAEMNCATAEAAARFARDVMSPAAQQTFGQALKSVSHASAYVCRARNGSHKLSEHAFGNALDIASFTLSDGTTIAVEAAPPEKSAIFLEKVRDAACGPFKTVLGPGSNADHAEHFHFDLAPRRNGGTVCE